MKNNYRLYKKQEFQKKAFHNRFIGMLLYSDYNFSAELGLGDRMSMANLTFAAFSKC